MTARLKAASGFTLIELMVVGAIVGFLVLIAIPNYFVWNSKYKLKSAVAELHADFGLARMAAMNQNTSVTVTVTQTSSTTPVTVTFRDANGSEVFPSLTLDPEVSLTNDSGVLVGGVVKSPQDVRFNSKGLRVNTGNDNNLCIDDSSGNYTGASCDNSHRQAFNFRNTGSFNYRIVVATTGKVSWCYTNTCAQ